MDKIVEIAKALADKHTIAGWELLDPDKQRAFEQEAEGYATYFQTEMQLERDSYADILASNQAIIANLREENDNLKTLVGKQADIYLKAQSSYFTEIDDLKGRNAKANYLKEQAEAERDTLKAILGNQEDRFWAQVTEDNRIIDELKSEVKAGAGMLADMHDKYQTVSQAVGAEWERFADFLLDHYKGALERGDNNSITIFAMILNFGDRYNLPGLKRRADKIREGLK